MRARIHTAAHDRTPHTCSAAFFVSSSLSFHSAICSELESLGGLCCCADAEADDAGARMNEGVTAVAAVSARENDDDAAGIGGAEAPSGFPVSGSNRAPGGSAGASGWPVYGSKRGATGAALCDDEGCADVDFLPMTPLRCGGVKSGTAGFSGSAGLGSGSAGSSPRAIAAASASFFSIIARFHAGTPIHRASLAYSSCAAACTASHSASSFFCKIFRFHSGIGLPRPSTRGANCLSVGAEDEDDGAPAEAAVAAGAGVGAASGEGPGARAGGAEKVFVSTAARGAALKRVVMECVCVCVCVCVWGGGGGGGGGGRWGWWIF
jgi:hypothetical protein